MPIQFRVNSSRMGFVKDSSCNYAIRSYFFKSNDFLDVENERTPNSLFYNFVCIMFLGLAALTNDCIETEDVKRIQIFNNPNDRYFSIVMGLKINSVVKNDIENANLRFNIARAGFYFNCFCIYTNAYETHLQTGSWDSTHCQEGPLVDFRLREALDFIGEALNDKKNECRTCISNINNDREIKTADVNENPDAIAGRASKSANRRSRNAADNPNPSSNDTNEGGNV